MSLRIRINQSKLTPQEKMIVGLLENSSMTSKKIVDTLMSEPYDLTFHEVFNATRGLKKKGLIVLDDFAGNISIFEIDTYFTFAPDWVFKL